MRAIGTLALVLCIAVLFASNGFPDENVTVDTHAIAITISNGGSAHISEKFRLSFETREARDKYLSMQQSGSFDVEEWKNLTSSIDTYVLGDKQGVSTFAQHQTGFDYVIIEYSIPNFAQQVDEQGRFKIYEIKGDQFSYYDNESGVFTLPSKTTLQLSIEDTRRSKNELITDYIELRPATFFIGPFEQENHIVLIGNGPISLNEFSVRFKAERTIGESWSFEALGNFFAKNPIYLVILIILAVLIAIYRKPVFGTLSESLGGEEDFELPRKGA